MKSSSSNSSSSSRSSSTNQPTNVVRGVSWSVKRSLYVKPFQAIVESDSFSPFHFLLFCFVNFVFFFIVNSIHMMFILNSGQKYRPSTFIISHAILHLCSDEMPNEMFPMLCIGCYSHFCSFPPSI